MKFRPCIDLHQGFVKQIVGSTMGSNLQINFQSEQSASYFAHLYKRNGLKGGHIIKLGPGNDEAAKAALKAYPNGLQIGGGINLNNARDWLNHGASQVIVTSAIFKQGQLLMDQLKQLESICGKDQIVIDLSCGKKGDAYYVMTDRWSQYSREKINLKLFEKLQAYCQEFLIHAVDVEGKQQGLDKDLVKVLSDLKDFNIVYAGGIHQMSDLDYLKEKSHHLDFSIGSALDIFGGDLSYSHICQLFA